MNQTASTEVPFDQGAAAYDQRKHWRENPYIEGSWQHDDWDDGWRMAEETDGKSFDWIADQFK